MKILDQKIVFFQGLIERHPKELNLYSILTLLYERLNRSEEAGKIYEKLLLEYPEDLNIVENYLLLLMRQKKYVEAESLTQRLQNQLSSSLHLRVMQGIILRQLKKYEAGLLAFEKIETQFEPDKKRVLNADFYLEWGLTQDLAAQKQGAEKIFLKGLDRSPQDCRLQNALAYLWAEQGVRLEEALILSQKSLENRPKEGSYKDTLAWIYFKMGRLSEAQAHLEEARLLTQEDPEVLGHLAAVYEKLGRSEEALVLWRSVFEKNAEFPKIKEKLLSLEEELKQSKAHVKSSP
jgi:tetratricopeptide (TPR) repeat protein